MNKKTGRLPGFLFSSSPADRFAHSRCLFRHPNIVFRLDKQSPIIKMNTYASLWINMLFTNSRRTQPFMKLLARG
jgi:hypothetical protein